MRPPSRGRTRFSYSRATAPRLRATGKFPPGAGTVAIRPRPPVGSRLRRKGEPLLDHSYGIKFLGALFAVMNPLVNLPIFLSLTDGQSVADQRRIALQVLFYAAVMCAVVAVGGQQILAFFGISVADFRVAGGLVLAAIGLHMLNGQSNPAHNGSPEEKPHIDATENIAFFPMTFPMVVGPGAITTLVVFLPEATSARDVTAYALVVAAILAALGVTLYFAAAIGARLSQTLRMIMTRLMGMILLAIAVDMIAAGLTALLPGLAARAG